jgi:hypothetical protein
MEEKPNVRPSGLQRLNEFPSYKGGDTCVHAGLYIWEFLPGHPLQNDWGWVAQHRLIAEDKIGRPLRQCDDPKIAEVGHHRDECKLNNDPSNIEVMTKSDHMRHHQLGKKVSRIDLTEAQVALALSQTGNSLKAAAILLGIHSHTIRNRFPELVAPIKRKAPANLDDVALLGRVTVLAADPDVGWHDAAASLGIAYMSVVRICKRYGIPWVAKVMDRKGSLHTHYRGKPTPRALAMSAAGIEPETLLSSRPDRKRSRERRLLAASEEAERRASVLLGSQPDLQGKLFQ